MWPRLVLVLVSDPAVQANQGREGGLRSRVFLGPRRRARFFLPGPGGGLGGSAGPLAACASISGCGTPFPCSSCQSGVLVESKAYTGQSKPRPSFDFNVTVSAVCKSETWRVVTLQPSRNAGQRFESLLRLVLRWIHCNCVAGSLET